MSDLTHEESILVTVPAEDLYDLVSDITRTGEWSPVCASCWWDDEPGRPGGAWFPGATRRRSAPGRPGRRWSRPSAGVEFAWTVGGNLVGGPSA